MCGIVGYIGGGAKACEVLIEGLKRLEYRGYDSAGLCVCHEGQLRIHKAPGRVATVEAQAKEDPQMLAADAGIAHTRWATHGQPNEANAHPHCDDSGKISLVHNGIIENYATLKQYLIERGHTFASETDTEVLVQLIGEFYDNGCKTLEDAVLAYLRPASTTGSISDALENSR